MFRALREMPLRGWVTILVIGLVVIWGLSKLGVGQLWDKASDLIPHGKGEAPVAAKDVIGGNYKVYKIGCNTWPGYVGGQYFNGGFKASKKSKYFQKWGFGVEFVLNDDLKSSLDAWKSGSLDLAWQTADVLSVNINSLMSFKPKVIFQPDWSRGGDLIIATAEINSVGDLRGKKVAYAHGFPSHSLLVQVLAANNMTIHDLQAIPTPGAVEATQMFKDGKVDAAVIWSPDDQDCLKLVKGSHVLKSTKELSNIIADIFFVKQELLDNSADRENIKHIVEGWLIGAAEINANKDSARQKAIEILVAGLNQPRDFIEAVFDGARLCTYGDNVNFFNINGDYSGMKGEELYSETAKLLQAIGGVKPMEFPAWRYISDSSLLREIQLFGPENAAENTPKFSEPTPEIVTKEAFSTKSATVNFATDSDRLDAKAKMVIERQFVPIVKGFRDSRIRVEGNTDIVGSHDYNVQLSHRRARSVINYLVSEYGIDPNRFVAMGNGPDKPVKGCEANATEAQRAANRRTDLEVL